MAVGKRRSKRSVPPKRARSKAAKPAAVPAATIVPPDRRRSENETLRLRAFEPSFTVNDLMASLRFYTDVLGFIVADQFKDDNGALMGVMLKAGVCQIGLSQDNWKKGRDRKKGDGFRLWCRTAQDVDALGERIRKGGWRLAEEPADQSWGVRSLSVDDPDGYRVSIYQDKSA
jgi:catechol 2,3-dioxygenase-like lactoylglutathione lyase family enzyme